MKLLILTQKVDENDDILGFFHGWIKEFSKHCESVVVICLQKGEYNLPDNVKVLSLGKEVMSPPPSRGRLEGGRIFITKLKYIFNFYKYIWQERKNYDKVFVHMNPEYVVLGGLLWRILGKKIALWYVHKNIDLKLKLAEKLVNIIFTASRESFRLKSDKVKIVGHGIDVEKFKTQNLTLKSFVDVFNIVYVGRISLIKNQELLLRAVSLLIKDQKKILFKIKLIGGTSNIHDEEYLGLLKDIVKKEKMDDVVEFVGSVANKNIIPYYQEADLHINLCPTGGMDKAVLEAMACGVPSIVLNQTFKNVFEKYGDELILKKSNTGELAEKIKKIQSMSKLEQQQITKYLRNVIVGQHNLGKLIRTIMQIYETSR